jgi:membrane protein implicated in regulation of membrane protease activity
MELLLDMVWWHWMVLGLFLAALELVTPGSFFIIFFGVAALLVGLLDLWGLAGPVWVQWLIFAVLSVVTLLVFRNPLLRLVRADQPNASLVDALITETAHALEDIPPDEFGRVELRGSAWSAKNVATQKILKGQRCTVQRVDGLKLYVLPEGAR